MFNFLIQIIISLFIGWSFVFLAKKHQKSQVFYFCIGFFGCLCSRIAYLLMYGLITDFSVTQDLDIHRDLSIIFSVIICYVLFRLMKNKLQKNNSEVPTIDDIGKE